MFMTLLAYTLNCPLLDMLLPCQATQLGGLLTQSFAGVVMGKSIQQIQILLFQSRRTSSQQQTWCPKAVLTKLDAWYDCLAVACRSAR